MHGKVAFVSGGAQGIGRATARRLSQAGARVVVGDIRSDGEQVARELRAAGAQALFVPLDVTSEGDWQAALDTTVQLYGRLDVLVNNAGISRVRPVDQMELSEWREVMAVNLDGVFLGTREAVRRMREFGQGGAIVNVSSASGLVGGPTASAYCASKGGVRLFTKAVALECAKDRIRVNSVHPGAVKTDIWDKSEWWPGFVAQAGGEAQAFEQLASATPLRRLASPEEVADAILFLASEQSQFITGSELTIDGGFTAG